MGNICDIFYVSEFYFYQLLPCKPLYRDSVNKTKHIDKHMNTSAVYIRSLQVGLSRIWRKLFRILNYWTTKRTT